jgi:hypothetical protein
MREQGDSFDEIAVACGYADRSGARKAVERGLSRWMRETDEDFRARELERTEMMIDVLWPLIDRADPDLKAMDQLQKLMNYRARIMGLYAKRPTVPDTYPGAPNRAAENLAQDIERYNELASKIYGFGYTSGLAAAAGYEDDDEDDDAMAGRASESTDAAADTDDEDKLVPQGKWIADKWVPGNWVDGKFVPADQNDPDTDPNRAKPTGDAEVRASVAEAFKM